MARKHARAHAYFRCTPREGRHGQAASAAGLHSTARHAAPTLIHTTTHARRSWCVGGRGGADYRALWIEDFAAKRRMAKLLFHSGERGWTIPKAYEVHRSVIGRRKRYSMDRISDQAMGLDPLATRLKEWILKSGERVQLVNRCLSGTWLPRLQLDVLSALRCTARCMIVENGRPPPWMTTWQRDMQCSASGLRPRDAI